MPPDSPVFAESIIGPWITVGFFFQRIPPPKEKEFLKFSYPYFEFLLSIEKSPLW